MFLSYKLNFADQESWTGLEEFRGSLSFNKFCLLCVCVGAETLQSFLSDAL